MHIDVYQILIGCGIVWVATAVAYAIARSVTDKWSEETGAVNAVFMVFWPVILLLVVYFQAHERFKQVLILGLTSTPDEQGYWLVPSSGPCIPFGNASQFVMKDIPVPRQLSGQIPVLHFDSEGRVFAPDGLRSYGDLATTKLDAPIVVGLLTESSNGYWLVSELGQVFAFGDARHFGDISVDPAAYGVHQNKRRRADVRESPTPIPFWAQTKPIEESDGAKASTNGQSLGPGMVSA